MERLDIDLQVELVDIDLHYDSSIDSRQHTENHIMDLITLYSEEISKLLKCHQIIGMLLRVCQIMKV